MNQITQVYVDLDGVLADFFGGVCDLLGKEPDPPDHFHGLASAFGFENDSELWELIDGAGSRFWSSLDPYPWNDELLNVAREIAREGMYIATSPSWAGSSAAGKIEWMTEHLGAPGKAYRDFMIGSHKHLLAHPNAMLIDDSPEKITAWRKAGGVAVLWPQPWNTYTEVEEARAECMDRLRQVA